MDISQRKNFVSSYLSVFIICAYKMFYFVASLLTARYKKAKEMNEVAKQTFQNVSESLTGILVKRFYVETVLLVTLYSAHNRCNGGGLDI